MLKSFQVSVILFFALIGNAKSFGFPFFSRIPESAELTIIHSNDTRGQIEQVCGCRGEAGGMSRRATKISSFQEKYDNLIIIDAGNTFSRNRNSTQNNGRLMVSILDQVGYDVLNITANDLTIGVDSLLKFSNEFDLSFISANLYDKKSDKLLFEPFKILNKDGLRIGLIGITHAQSLPSDLDLRIAINDYHKLLDKYLKKLNKKCDVVILLSDCSRQVNHSIAQDYPGIDILLTNQFSPKGYRTITNVLTGRVSPRGKSIGKIELSFEKNKPLQSKGEIIPIERKINEDFETNALIEKYLQIETAKID